MKRHSFDYSTKNIPIPSKKLYLSKLIEKTELLIKRMRWKVIFSGEERKELERKENFGFRSRNCPKQHPDLIDFENDLLNMVKNVTFRTVHNDFQDKLKKDISNIKNSKNAFIFADKTRNIYEMNKATHDKLYLDNVTKSYKKSTDETYDKINTEAKKIATELKIADRAEVMAKGKAFITIKDHKENFETNPKCRVINPAKSELGKVSKIKLENINNELRSQSYVNQWKNSDDVIEWFQNINDKRNCVFVQFDIEEFYPSISKRLVCKALDYAKQYKSITAKEVQLIMHARKSLLFTNESTWVKRGDDPSFDVTMGSFDGAEVCELVGLYILNILGDKFGKDNIGLYRDDGLACFHGINGSTADRIRKDIVKLFKDQGLKITIQTNLKVVNFLDVTFNLETCSYEPYRKPNDQPLYINKQSNHPPNIIKSIPKNISRRISNISSTMEIFNDAAPIYNNALAASGYSENVEFMESPVHSSRRRSRNIIWYNPPYSLNVQTNIAKKFLQLVSRHFPKGHKLNKLFNRNNVKVSYSCMPSINSIITSHNKKVLTNKDESRVNGCNCRNKDECPLNGNCLDKNVVYQAKVSVINRNQQVSNYVGVTENEWKDRSYKHKNSFKDRKKRNDTQLSNHIWNLKEKGIKMEDIVIEWKIIDHAAPYVNGSRKCNLCLTEKYHIITSTDRLLNKRSELVSKCRHENKYYLMNVKEVPPDIY